MVKIFIKDGQIITAWETRVQIVWKLGNKKINNQSSNMTNKDVIYRYSEIKYYQFGYGGFSMQTGHFTQVVWKDTKELGVAIGRARNNKLYIVANYYPPGNYQGRFQQNVPRPIN